MGGRGRVPEALWIWVSVTWVEFHMRPPLLNQSGLFQTLFGPLWFMCRFWISQRPRLEHPLPEASSTFPVLSPKSYRPQSHLPCGRTSRAGQLASSVPDEAPRVFLSVPAGP